MNTARRWLWMMNYCAKRELPPAEKWVWDLAARAYAKTVKQPDAGL